jgi:aminomethyltransferase
VTNAANHETDLEWMAAHAGGYDADLVDAADKFAMLAVQGPRARAIVAELADGSLPPRMHCCERVVAGAAMLVCGTGYTGEDGVELLLSPDDAPEVWDALLGAGVTPVGLGARDTLRLEACFHLYGNDLGLDRNPIEAGLGWACREATGFIGAEAIKGARDSGPAEKLVPFVIEGAGIARQGNPILGGGVVTSGTFSPSLERGIGMAYVPAASAAPGTTIEIDVRGTIRAASVHTKPLYEKES